MGIVSPLKLVQRGIIKGEIQPEQMQPNGIDLTLKAVRAVFGGGVLHKHETVQPSTEEILPSAAGYYELPVGHCYQVDFYEEVKVPLNVCGSIIARSSLNRMGGFITSGLYDSGFENYLGAVLRLNAPLKIEKGARIAQIVFFEAESDFSYDGQYQKS